MLAKRTILALGNMDAAVCNALYKVIDGDLLHLQAKVDLTDAQTLTGSFEIILPDNLRLKPFDGNDLQDDINEGYRVVGSARVQRTGLTYYSGVAVVYEASLDRISILAGQDDNNISKDNPFEFAAGDTFSINVTCFVNG